MIVGVILAAGESRRMGQTKQLMTIRGQTMLQCVADAALASRLDRVLVVTGHRAADVQASLDGRPVTFIHNERYRQGLGSSVCVAMDAVPPDADGVLFLMADQPGVSSILIDRLIDPMSARAATGLIVAPLVEGRRTTPTLFGRDWF
ncbi:MAG: nucleotidyltransferase family protein, partial [Chloroflexota bacterium]